MRAILLIALVLAPSSAYYLNDWNQFCQVDTNGTNCYNLFEDQSFPRNFNFYYSIINWATESSCWPYVSWATALAMALTYNLKTMQTILYWPVYDWEHISASWIMLKGYQWNVEPGFFNCDSGNMYGQYVGYTFEDQKLYNDWNFYLGIDFHVWCDWSTYTDYLNNESPLAERYDIGIDEVDLTGMTYQQIADHLYMYGMLITTIAYSTDMATDVEIIPNQKYVYTEDPATFYTYGTIVIFGVWQDTDGIWLMANMLQTGSPYNKLLWIRPSQSVTGSFTYVVSVLNARSWLGTMYDEYASWTPWNYYSVPPPDWEGI